MRGSETRLGQVFVNLLVNAAQAILEGNVAGNEICITADTDAEGRIPNACVEKPFDLDTLRAAVATRR